MSSHSSASRLPVIQKINYYYNNNNNNQKKKETHNGGSILKTINHYSLKSNLFCQLFLNTRFEVQKLLQAGIFAHVLVLTSNASSVSNGELGAIHGCCHKSSDLFFWLVFQYRHGSGYSMRSSGMTNKYR